MDRPLQDTVKDFEDNPTEWELIRTESVPSTRRRNRGGTSVQEQFRHRATGEEIVRHTLLRPSGMTFGRTHFRRDWK